LDAITDRRGQEVAAPAALRASTRNEAAERGIPKRLAPALTGAGGLLVALGAVGIWVRATTLPTGGSIPEEVAVVSGGSAAGGWMLLGIGLVTTASAVAWLSREARIRALAAGLSVVAIASASIRLTLTDGRAAMMAEEAASSTGIDAFHAGYGWGAWLLLVGAVLLALGLLAGGLRELDLRRGS
jgi:hypothetical protein